MNAEVEAKKVYDKWLMDDCAIKEVRKPRDDKNWRWVCVNGKYFEFQTQKMVKRIKNAIDKGIDDALKIRYG